MAFMHRNPVRALDDCCGDRKCHAMLAPANGRRTAAPPGQERKNEEVFSMSASTVLILFLVAMVLSIYFGNQFDAIGLISMSFAYLIGVFGLGLKTSVVVGMFPAKILFTIIGICWLFGYANENGTLRQITLILVYRFRRFPSILPWVFFLIAGVICMTGASPYAPNAVLMPIIISICLATNMNPLFGSLMINIGSYIGAQAPWGQGANIRTILPPTSIGSGPTAAILLPPSTAYRPVPPVSPSPLTPPAGAIPVPRLTAAMRETPFPTAWLLRLRVRTERALRSHCVAP